MDRPSRVFQKGVYPLHIYTDRLHLVAADAVLTEAEIEGPEKLSARIGARIDQEWPPEDLAEVLPLFLGMLRDDPGLRGWLHWYVLLREPEPVLVGSVGFRGGPDASGMVEIGYSVDPGFRRLGYAAEMVRGLCGWAFIRPGVVRVEAETALDNTSSLGVLRACGFDACGPGGEPGFGRFALSRR